MKVSLVRRGSPTHDTDVKSFVPDLEGAMNFIGRFSPTGKDNIAACIDRTTMRF
jgi:hypothetical protein